MPDDLSGALSGLRVLDLSSNLAGPLAAMTLGDLGADVIKVERPDRGDDTRGLPPRWQEQGAVFLSVNRNKRSLALDLRSDEGRDILLALAGRSDVLIESFGPGVADRLGLGFDAVRSASPRIIYCTVSAFGEGPVGRTLPGYDSLIQAFSGMMSITGHADGPPARVAPSAIDLSTGLWGVVAILVALGQRAADGEARHVRAALIDSAFTLMGHQVIGVLATGRSPGRLGSASPSTMPNGAFRAADGWVVVATANDKQFARFCDVLGRPELADDPRFETVISRVEHRDELHTILVECFAQDTVEGWIERLGSAGLPAGRLQELDAAVHDPLVAERGLFVQPANADGPDALPQIRIPIDAAGDGVRRWPPQLGEHTDEVLREVGLDAERIADLRARGVVGTTVDALGRSAIR
jgi:crotonobetainyl-CoA:carnitine CoA-transferase CaiB-like acyl-CoA transferase